MSVADSSDIAIVLTFVFPTSCDGEQMRTELECKVTPLELSLLKWGVRWAIGF